MFIEIKGIGLPNRGAELMLICVINEIKKEYPQAKFVLEANTSYEERSKHQVYQKFNTRFKGLDFGFVLEKIIPKTFFKKYGLILDSEINIIIDASGFAYSDQWGALKAYNRLARDIVKHKKLGKKVILMPQAFGPFEDDVLKKYMARIVKNSDLIFARDDKSFEFLSELDPFNKLKIAPDFTNLIKGSVPKWFLPTDKDVCFITNSKIIEKGGSEQANNYIPFMTKLIGFSQNSGMNPYILLHEGEKDLALAEEINNALDNPVKIYKTSDALEIKGIIGSSRICVSSRFHGLVSALSQGVPVIATGWSHKYRMLLSDYGCQNYIVDASEVDVKGKLELLFDKAIYDSLKSEIISASTEQKKLSEAMWTSVLNVLK